jgi:amino acid adenylation domain-containing protein
MNSQLHRDFTGELFARESPESHARPALVHEGATVTYGELIAMAYCCAGKLLRHGVQPGAVVGLWGARSPRLVAALLGALRAGAAYVYLDPRDPVARLRRVIGVAHVEHLLHTSGPPPFLQHALTCIDVTTPGRHPAPASQFREPEPTSVASIIATSGSSGSPKLVALTRRAMSARLRGQTQRPGSQQRCQRASFSTVAHVGDLLLPLVKGDTIHIIDDTVASDTLAFASRIREGAITLLNVLPSHLQVLMTDRVAADMLRCVQTFVVSGEAVPERLVEGFHAVFPHAQLINAYGLTETVGVVAAASMHGSGAAGMRALSPAAHLTVVDRETGQPAPCGEMGEVWITGEQLAQGYVGMDELTNERFVLDATDPTSPRAFRTGDLGRLCPDGSIVLGGRIDREIKVSGFRVNLADVERALCAHQAVEHAVVVLDDNTSSSRTTAFIETSGPSSVDLIESLRTRLRRSLPDYMIPSRFVRLAELPRLSAGKVDHETLKALTRSDRCDAVTVAFTMTDTEASVAAIWCQALAVPLVDPDEDFLAAGGDSLSAIAVSAALRQTFGVTLRVTELYRHATIRRVAALIDAQGA